MSSNTPDPTAAPNREALQLMARALTHEPETARLLLGILVDCATDRDLANAVRWTVQSFLKTPSLEAHVNRKITLMETERPAFFDPNRPGE